MDDEIRYTSGDGKEWIVSLESPGKLLSVDPDLENSGANLPEHEIRIVFRSGGTELSEEYTALTSLEDLSDDDLEEWFEAARTGSGV